MGTSDGSPGTSHRHAKPDPLGMVVEGRHEHGARGYLSLWPKEWSDILYRTDSVLDFADIDRFSDIIGSDVTKVRIPGGVHDLVLSAKPVRENVYRELFDWMRSRGF